VTTFRRYVAIGDSSTEGLEDPDGAGGYRGWADRLAEHIAGAQDEPLEYANLAVRGLRVDEIRRTQLAPALELRPDLLTLFAGVNDVIGLRCDFAAMAQGLDEMFGAARATGTTVLTFTMPDPGAVNPLVRHLRPRMARYNDVVRTAAAAHDVVVLDFSRYPIACDRRLWYADRLHNNALGHDVIARAFAWRLGVAGFDESWADPLPEDPPPSRPHQVVAGDVDWAVHHLAPWLGKGIRHVPHGLGVTAKRPVPTVVPRSGRLSPSVSHENVGNRS
jgi:lysophospholipase L1-like esterase